MKTTIIATVAIIMIAITSFKLYSSEVASKEEIGLQIITALQHSSVHEYSALFPTLADFHTLMLKNSELYGKNLSQAALDFEKEYEYHLYPAFKESFLRIIREGHLAGVDWRTIQLKSVEVPEMIDSDFAAVPMTITFTSQGKEYRLKIEKALIMNGKWKISHFISLEK
jgi:hypothetical protein